MADAGFFKGTSADQDARFADKKKKLMKTMKFGDNLSKKVDMSRINLESLRPWIVKRVTELLNFEDEVVCDYVFNQLEERHPDPKDIQINITGFLNSKNARIFLTELWDLLLSAMESPNGIPAVFLEAKRNEIAGRQEEAIRVQAELNRKDELCKGNRTVMLTSQVTPNVPTVTGYPNQLQQKHEPSTTGGESREAVPANAIKVIASSSSRTQKESTEKHSSSKRRRRRRSRDSSSSSGSSRSSSDSGNSRRRKRHRRRHRRSGHRRNRSRSDDSKKWSIPGTDWRKDLMAGRRRSPPAMPENSYYGYEKHIEKPQPHLRERHRSRDREEKIHHLRTNYDDIDSMRVDNTARRSHHNRRRNSERSSDGYSDDAAAADWRNRSPKQSAIEVDDDGVVSRRNRSRDVQRSRGAEQSGGAGGRPSSRDRYRGSKHAADWMHEAERAVEIRTAPSKTLQPKTADYSQNGRYPKEPKMASGVSADRRSTAINITSAAPLPAKKPKAPSSSSASSSSSSSGSDSDEDGSSSGSSETSSSGDDDKPHQIPAGTNSRVPTTATATTRQRGSGVTAPTPEGPSLLPSNKSAVKQITNSPEGPTLPTVKVSSTTEGPALPPPAAAVAASDKRHLNGGRPSAPAPAKKPVDTNKSVVVQKQLPAVSSSSGSGDSSGSSDSESGSESGSETGTSSSDSASDGGSGDHQPTRNQAPPQTKKQRPVSDDKSARSTKQQSPEGPSLPPPQSRSSAEVDKRRQSDRKKKDKHEESLRRRALASMMRASGDGRRSP